MNSFVWVIKMCGEHDCVRLLSASLFSSIYNSITFKPQTSFNELLSISVSSICLLHYSSGIHTCKDRACKAEKPNL